MIWQMESGPKDVVGAMGGSGPTDVWFAGSNGTVLHTAGDGKWENRNFNGPTFTGLFVAGPNDVYATGMINVVYHWDGSGTWDHQFLGTAFEDNGIWGSCPHDIYTVGSGAFHSTGDRVWTPQSLTGAPASFSPFIAVWGSGPTDIYFLIGDASVLHSHGDDKWDTQTTGLKAYGAGLWGSGPNDIYALSTDVVAHSVGDGKWSVQKFDRTSDETPSSIWGSGARDVYIGTVDGTIFRSLGDGKWYRERLFPNDSRKFIVVAAIWGSSADDVYVVTSVGTLRGHPQ